MPADYSSDSSADSSDDDCESITLAPSHSSDIRRNQCPPWRLPTGAYKKGLKLSLLKMLLLDLNDRGGLHVADLKTVCDAKEDVYGAPGSSLRLKIQQQVKRWIKRSEKRFREIYNSIVFGDDEDSFEDGFEPNVPKKAPRKTKSHNSKPPATKKHKQSKAPTQPPPISEVRTISQTPQKHKETMSHLLEEQMEGLSIADSRSSRRSKFSSSGRETKTIQVDHRTQEYDDNISILHFTNSLDPVTKKLSNGYEMIIPVSYLQYAKNPCPYSAKVLTSNKIAVQMSSHAYGQVENTAEYNEAIKDAGFSTASMDAARNQWLNNVRKTKSRQVHTINFVFPEVLDNDVFSSQEEAGNIKGHLIPMDETAELDGEGVEVPAAFIHFIIACKEEEARFGDVEAEEEGKTGKAVAEIFKRKRTAMNMSGIH